MGFISIPFSTYTKVSRTVEQPFKIPFVAAVILISNPQNPDVARETLIRAASDARKYLEGGSWRQFKLVLRFLGCLQGLFEGDGIFTVLEELFLRAVDLQTASSEDVSRLCILHGSLWR